MAKIVIQHEPGCMPEFVMEEMTAGILSGFFPVSMIREEERCTVVYDAAAYRQLKQVEEISIYAFLCIFGSLLELVEEHEKQYLSAAQYEISVETVYVDVINHAVRMICQYRDTQLEGKQQCCKLLSQCMEKVSHEGQAYLSALLVFLEQEETSITTAIHRCRQLQQEVYVCDIQ